MNEKVLRYLCAQCGAMALHAEGPHFIDSGTTLFCDRCDGQTVAMLLKPEAYRFCCKALAERQQTESEVEILCKKCHRHFEDCECDIMPTAESEME